MSPPLVIGCNVTSYSRSVTKLSITRRRVFRQHRGADGTIGSTQAFVELQMRNEQMNMPTQMQSTSINRLEIPP